MLIRIQIVSRLYILPEITFHLSFKTEGHAAEEYYKPSSELLELFSEVLSQDEVKHEVKEIVDRKPTIIKPEPEDVKMPGVYYQHILIKSRPVNVNNIKRL